VTRGDATRRAAGVTRTSLFLSLPPSLSVLFRSALFPSLLLYPPLRPAQRIVLALSLSLSLSHSLAARCSPFLPLSRLHVSVTRALFDRRVSSLLSPPPLPHQPCLGHLSPFRRLHSPPPHRAATLLRGAHASRRVCTLGDMDTRVRAAPGLYSSSQDSPENTDLSPSASSFFVLVAPCTPRRSRQSPELP